MGELLHVNPATPEWRLGQTLADVAMTAGHMAAGGVWDLEDDEALAAVRELLGQIRSRSEPALVD